MAASCYRRVATCYRELANLTNICSNTQSANEVANKKAKHRRLSEVLNEHDIAPVVVEFRIENVAPVGGD
jgi:hypothetical protein